MDLMHNARLKRYPDGSGEILIGSRPFGGGSVSRLPSFADDGEPPFRYSDDEARYADMERDAIQAGDDVRSLAENAAIQQQRSILRSVRRAKKAVKDLARSNDWAYFVTLTLSPEKVNRYDPEEVLRHLRHWLGNNVRRKGLVYVLVPEHHKDGAIHFHGLFNDALSAVDSGTMSVPGRKAPVKVRSDAHRTALERAGGHAVYNLPDWGWGFSTAIQLYGEKDRAINYVCKYIGKEMEDGAPAKIGGRWYYSGGSLLRPTVEWFDVDVRDYEKTPGWFQPEDYPYAWFLAMRVTSEGEVLPPYSRPVEENAKHGSAEECPEGTSGPARSSAGPADPATREIQSRAADPSEQASGLGSLCLTAAPAPGPIPEIIRDPKGRSWATRRILEKNRHLTFLGLSSQARAPAAQPAQTDSQDYDQLILFGKDECL